MIEFLTSIAFDRWILDFLLLFPLIGAGVVAFVPVARARQTALALTTIEFIISLGLWWAFDSANPAMQFSVSAPWLAEWGIYYRVGLDGISLFMVLLSTGIMPLAVLASYHYITERERL